MTYGKTFLISTLFVLLTGDAFADLRTYTCDETLQGFGEAVPFSEAELAIKSNGAKEFRCNYGSEVAETPGGSTFVWPSNNAKCAFKGQGATTVLGKTRISCSHKSASECVLECEVTGPFVRSKGKTK